MKPTAKMLGRSGSPARRSTDAGTPVAVDAERPGGEIEIEIASAMLARGGLVDHVEVVLLALSRMDEPPTLGVPAKGEGLVPLREIWEAARREAGQRLLDLHAQLTADLEVLANERPSDPAPPDPEA